MVWNKTCWLHALLLCALMPLLHSCSIQMGLAPITSIDYNKVKTIQIATFPNYATYVYGPMTTTFNDRMKDVFMQQTRLQLVDRDGDLVIDGEITGYNQYNEAVDSSGYSSTVKVTMTVKVSYTNKFNSEQDFTDQTFSAYQTYDATQLLTQVQDELIEVMVKDIVDQIFNATVASW